MSVVTSSSSFVQKVQHEVSQLGENIQDLSLIETQGRLKDVNRMIAQIRSEEEKLDVPMPQQVQTAHEALLRLKTRLEEKELSRLLKGCKVLNSGGRAYEDERGTAPGIVIVGKALEEMLKGNLSTREAMDEVMATGSSLYDAMTERKSLGTQLYWDEIRETVGKNLRSSEEEIQEVLHLGNEKEMYLGVLTKLQAQMKGKPIGGILQVGLEYFGVMIDVKKVYLFDPNGKMAPGTLIQADSLELGAEVLAMRRSAYEKEKVWCIPVEGAEEAPKVQVVEEEEVAPQLPFASYKPVLTETNREEVVRLIRDLERAQPDQIKGILARYPRVNLAPILDNGVHIKAAVLVLKAELHFSSANLLVPTQEEERGVVHTPKVEELSESDDEEMEFFDCLEFFPEEQEAIFSKKTALTEKAKEVGTLFIRDHVIPQIIKEDVVDQRVILEQVEGWFQSFLPTLFFDQGESSSQEAKDLAAVSSTLHSMTAFLKDYNAARTAEEQSRGWLTRRPSQAELNDRIHQRLVQGQESEQVILKNFAIHLVDLFELKNGKAMDGNLKDKIATHTATVLDALIDTVLSPEFAKMITLGFLHDDQIVSELKALPSGQVLETTPGKVPPELHKEATAFVNELIDFGNPRYSTWIATSMLKTHFLRTDNPSYAKMALRFGMRMLTKPIFKDEIGTFLSNAFATQRVKSPDSTEWVDTATIAMSAIRRYSWDHAGRSLQGRVQDVPDIPDALYRKITLLATELGPDGTEGFLSKTSWVMPSVHTFAQDLSGNLYGLSQSKPLMRTLTIRYIVKGSMTQIVRTAIMNHPTPIPPPLALQGPQDLSMEASKQMMNLVGNYLEHYVGQLYLKQTPLVSSIVDLSVVMVKDFVPQILGTPNQSAFPKAKQQMVVDFYGSIGTFLHDYSLAVQEAKQDEAFEVFASEGKEEELLLSALEKVRGGALKISNQDVQVKLEAITDMIVRSHCKGISPVKVQMVRSTSLVIPKLVKGLLDLFFSPEMMSALVTGYIREYQSVSVDDPHHQYQSWDNEVLIRWNDSLFNLMKGVVQLGEPSGKMEGVIESVLGLSDGAQKNLGSILARFSSGPSPLMAPAHTLQTVANLERMLFDEEQKPKMTKIFDQTDRKQREEALRAQLKGILTEPLPMNTMQSISKGWIGTTVSGVMEFSRSASDHLGSLSTMMSTQTGVSSDGPLVRALKQEVEERSMKFLEFLSPSGAKQLEGGVQGVLQDKLAAALEIKDYASGSNPVLEFLDNSCSNIVRLFNSPKLMRAYVYNYVLTPEFFNHLLENLDGSGVMSESGLAKYLPDSLFLDMCSLSWVLPGVERNKGLLEAPEMVEGISFIPIEPTQESFSIMLQDSNRLFAGIEASPMISSLYEKLYAWEKAGIADPDFTKGCLDRLGNAPAFTKHLIEWMEKKDEISQSEKEILSEACSEGNFPFVFRYLDLMLTPATPLTQVLFGKEAIGNLKQKLLIEVANGKRGECIQHIEKMQLAKSIDQWLQPHVEMDGAARTKIEAALKLLVTEKSDLPYKERITFFIEKLEGALKLEGVSAIFIEELSKRAKGSEDPIKELMQLFSANRCIQFWDEKTEKIHETLGALRMKDPMFSAKFEAEMKEFYRRLGWFLANQIKEPHLDRLKIAISNHFLVRYQSLARAVAPNMGDKVINSCSCGMVSNAAGGNQNKLAFLKSASKSIIMSGCYFGGELFDQALEIIETSLAEKKDLDVKLIGSEYMLTSSNRDKIRQLEELYPNRFYMLETSEVQLYTSPISDRTSYRTNHSKILVIDYGKYFTMGGSGLADRWSTSGVKPQVSSKREMQPLAFRDTDFLFRSEERFGVGYGLYLELLSLFPVWKARDVKERIQASFDPRFNHVSPPEYKHAKAVNMDEHPRRRDISKTTFYSTGPDDTNNPMLADLIRDIKGAKKSIHIQHMYFHPVPELMDALKAAAKRNVAIHLVTNRSGSDMPMTHELYTELSRAMWKELHQGEELPNLKLFEFNVANTTLHKKIIFIDGEVTYTGSSNMGEKSLKMNDHEMNVRLESSQLGSDLLTFFQQDLHYSIEVPQKEVLRREVDRAAIAEVQSSILQRWL